MMDDSMISVSVTFEEFERRFGGKRYEYVDGRVLPMGPEVEGENGEVIVGPTKLVHGIIVGQIAAMLGQFVYEQALGVVLGAETGFLMQKEPPELRAADVAFVPKARIQAIGNLEGWLPFPPDLAVEVISDWDRVADMRRKARSYMANGTRLLWMVYPQEREIEVFGPDVETQTLGLSDVLEGGDMLPGFSVPLKDIFAALDILAEDD